MNNPEMSTAVFPGSFNPFTIGHKSIVDRALPLFDKIIIAIGINESKSSFDEEELRNRIRAISSVYQGDSRVEVCSYVGLTTDFAKEAGAKFLLRGVRSVQDFEYERTLADVNRRIGGIETILLYALPEHASISSSILRELRHYGVDTTDMLPS